MLETLLLAMLMAIAPPAAEAPIPALHAESENVLLVAADRPDQTNQVQKTSYAPAAAAELGDRPADGTRAD